MVLGKPDSHLFCFVCLFVCFVSHHTPVSPWWKVFPRYATKSLNKHYTLWWPCGPPWWFDCIPFRKSGTPPKKAKQKLVIDSEISLRTHQSFKKCHVYHPSISQMTWFSLCLPAEFLGLLYGYERLWRHRHSLLQLKTTLSKAGAAGRLGFEWFNAQNYAETVSICLHILDVSYERTL